MDSARTSSLLKRKTMEDFFSVESQKRHVKVQRTCKEQDKPRQNTVPGLRVIPDFVTSQEEAELLSYLDNEQWRTDLLRRVIHYGGTYCCLPPRTATAAEKRAIEDNIITAKPIPSSLDFVIERMVEGNLYAQSNKPEYCIVNEYKDNQGISAHVENFKFISPVCGLTLGCGDWIRFHELTAPDDGSVRTGKAAKASRTGKKVDVWMPSRSLLIMSGEARTTWQHEIVRSKKDRIGNGWRRVSLTFRAERIRAR